MISENSKIGDPHRLILNLTDKMNLKRSDRYVAYTWKKQPKYTKTANLKYQHQQGMKNLNYLMDHVQYQIFKIISNIFFKNHVTVTDNPTFNHICKQNRK